VNAFSSGHFKGRVMVLSEANGIVVAIFFDARQSGKNMLAAASYEPEIEILWSIL
jgi:tagatose-1,6-bisphosphate aldolase